MILEYHLPFISPSALGLDVLKAINYEHTLE
jgi:hypothetical protein